MKQRLPFVVVAVLLVVMMALSACAPAVKATEVPASSDAAATEAPAATEAASTEPVTIKVVSFLLLRLLVGLLLNGLLNLLLRLIFILLLRPELCLLFRFNLTSLGILSLLDFLLLNDRVDDGKRCQCSGTH